MPVVSMWISSKESVAPIWLKDSVAALEELKITDIVNFLLIRIDVELLKGRIKCSRAS